MSWREKERYYVDKFSELEKSMTTINWLLERTITTCREIELDKQNSENENALEWMRDSTWRICESVRGEIDELNREKMLKFPNSEVMKIIVPK